MREQAVKLAEASLMMGFLCGLIQQRIDNCRCDPSYRCAECVAGLTAIADARSLASDIVPLMMDTP